MGSFPRLLSPRTSGLGLGVPTSVSSSSLEAGIKQGPILLAGLAIPFESIISILSRFSHYIAVSSPPSSAGELASTDGPAAVSRTRTTILGTYDQTFSGDEFVAYLVENVSHASVGVEAESNDLITAFIQIEGLG